MAEQCGGPRSSGDFRRSQEAAGRGRQEESGGNGLARFTREHGDGAEEKRLVQARGLQLEGEAK